MKRLAVFVVLLSTVAVVKLHAQQSADDQYIFIYSEIEHADSISDTQQRRALSEYSQAQTELQRFSKVFPDWNPKIVTFRLNYLAEKVSELSGKLAPSMPPAAPAVPGITNITNATPIPAENADTKKLQAQMESLQSQIQNLQANNTTLEAKLKEALSTQPSMVDARQLAESQAQMRELMKENELLKVSLAQAKTPATRGDAATLARLQQQFAEANRKLGEESSRADRLQKDNERLQARMKELLSSPEANEALREENELLKKQVAQLKSSLAVAVTNGPGDGQLKKAQEQIAQLQSQLETVAMEKVALQNRIHTIQAGTNGTSFQIEMEGRINQITHERDLLLEKLDAANKQLRGGKTDVDARVSELTDEVNALRARIAADEAQAVPYTTQELALMKQSPPPGPNAEKKPASELPEGTAALVAEAQNYFAQKQFDKAQDDYEKILQRDQNNGLVLANLAAIELQQNKLADAEKHIKAALGQSPNDSYNLSILGYIKFQQEKYDEALDALSRAAKLDPQNPEIQNYLGVTLSHKGLRGQAESALRRAIQIDPNYAAAHNNLAVIYLTQQPPSVELARYHYQRAIESGGQRNPDFEKALAEKSGSTPVNH